jgi:hypothetical protein
MPAPRGNRNNPHGRPPRLEAVLAQADVAAHRVARLLDRPGSISRCAALLASRWRAGERDLRPMLDAEGLEHVAPAHLEAEIRRRLFVKSRALLALLAPHAGALLDDLCEETALALQPTGQRKWRRRGPEPKIHENDWSRWVASAAIALDRLVGEDIAQ